MEKLPHVPRSVSSFRRDIVSPSSFRMLRQVLNSRDTSRFINISSTFKHLKNPPSESSELSMQLTFLRKHLDKFSLSNFDKESRLRNLKFELKEMNDSEIVKKEEIQRFKYYKEAKKEICEASAKINEELEDQKVLENMLDRLRVTKRFLEKKEKKIKKKLDHHAGDLDVQAKAMRGTLDSVSQFKVVFKAACNQVEFEKGALAEEISRLETQSELKKKMIEKTEEHNRHRLEIVEMTMIDERSAHLEDLRNEKLLSFFFFGFLRKRLMTSKENFNKLNEAFMEIKVNTGLQTIDEVIERFLTQEHNYRELTSNLHAKENKCNLFKQKISDMHSMVVQLSQEKTEKFGDDEKAKGLFEAISKLKEKKADLQKVSLLIGIWISKMSRKLAFRFDRFDSASLKSKFLMFGGSLKSVIADYKAIGSLSFNEQKRLKSRLSDIIQSLQTRVIHSSEVLQNSKKPSKSFHKK